MNKKLKLVIELEIMIDDDCNFNQKLQEIMDNPVGMYYKGHKGRFTK